MIGQVKLAGTAAALDLTSMFMLEQLARATAGRA